MMKDVLRQLCMEVGWSYAVFWRAIGAPNPTHFVWEDGCCQPTRAISGFKAMDFLLKEQGLVRNSSNGNFAGYQIEDKISDLLQNIMRRQINVLGDGIVGQAAVNGDHHWILRDNIGNNGSSPNVLAELNNQFLSGIQTIVVIPVLPYGVAQLGSMQMVMEDVGFVNHVRSLFANLARSGSLFISSTSKTLRRKGQIFGISETENLVGTSSDQSSFTILRDNMKSNAAQLPLNMISRTSLRSSDSTSTNRPTLNIGNSAQNRSSRPFFQGSLKNSDINPSFCKSESVGNITDVGNFCDLQGGIAETVTTKLQTSNSDNSSIVNRSIVDGCHQNLTNAGKYANELDNDFDKQSSKFDANGFFYEPQFGSASYDGRYEKVTPFLMAPTLENDLFDVVGMDCRISSNSNDLFKKDEKNDFVSSETDSLILVDYDIAFSGIFLESEPEQLLDAVVSNFQSNSVKNIPEESMSCKTSTTDASSTLLEPISGAYGDMYSAQQKQGEVFSISEDSSQKYGGYKSQISLRVENGQSLKSSSASAVQYKRVEESGKLNRKRARSGESSRPRPKDRQMIQDRIKELREIVPNSAKCSIDALLEKTIKHMVFLQCVTKHGDNLKDTGEPKIICKEGGLLLKDDYEGGTTWALEVGTESTICPIIVEDLSPPRQMLVEMLCEERGFFLEIADLIRGMGLSILKGVMEARKDKIWARFAVEANRDVTRMEIFLSLVRLLEPSAASDIAQGTNNIKMTQNVANQATIPVIPVTGSSDHLI